MGHVSVQAVASYVKDMFKVEMELPDVIRLSAEALKLLNMYATCQHIVVDRISDQKVHLTDAYKIEAVIRLQTPYWYRGFKVLCEDIYFPDYEFFVSTEPDPTPTYPLLLPVKYIDQIKGPYIDFTWNCPFLEFNETDTLVAIKYNGVSLDKQGYPMIPEQAFLACCYYCLYINDFPLARLGKIPPQIFQLTMELKDQKFRQARAQKMIDELNQNEINKLGDIMSSMDRKAHGLPM